METPAPVEELRIVLYPDPVLRKRCKPVEDFDGQLEALAQRMLFLMHEARGLGLAAPQVGVPIRMFVSNFNGQPENDTVWVNPVLLDLEGAIEAEEGCLSIPGISVPKRRATNAGIEGYNLKGQPARDSTTELLARVWQHELDHLNGLLVIDCMSETVELANRRIIRQLETDYSAAKRKGAPRWASSSSAPAISRSRR